MTGYLDRLVQRAAGQSPGALTPRRRSRYEDSGGEVGGLQVVDAERVAPTSGPSAVPGTTSTSGVAERGERASAAAPTPSAVSDDSRQGAEEPSRPAVHGLRPDTAATSETSADEDQVAATGTPAAPRPAPVHAATARAVPAPSAPAPSTAAAADSTSAHAALETTPVAHDGGRGAMAATTRLASSASDAAPPQDADAAEAAATWPPAISTSLERASRRRSPAAAAASEPVIVEVTIGRIEIRAVPEPAPAPARTSAAPPLADYLRDRARTDGVRR